MQYPSGDINPKLKNRDWLLNNARALWTETGKNVGGMFYRYAPEYSRIKSYVLGEQDTAPYKRHYVDENGQSWSNIDYRPRATVAKFRDIAISKMQQADFNVIATPVDSLAKDDADKYYADAKAKIMMRDQLKQMNPQLAASPALKKQPGDSEDLEELEIQMGYGWKHNMAIEAEQGFTLIAYQNGITQQRRQLLENLFDYGVGGYKEWIDEKGQVRLRAINPMNVVTNYCRKPDFSDLTHVGEVIEVSLTDLASLFTDDELKEIQSQNTTSFEPFQPLRPVGKDRTVASVLDLEFWSYDDKVFEQRESKGNLVMGMSEYGNKFRDNRVTIQGKEQPKFTSRRVKSIYRCKWIIGTKFIYDDGLATNQKRDRNALAETCLSYHLFAYNFHEMKAQSIMQRLIPILDEYQITIYKIQNFKNKWIPYIIDIDLDALEGVALGDGGKNLTPHQLLDMAFQTHVLLSRRRDMSNTNINYKSIDVQATPMANEFSVLISDLQRLYQEISDISGFNPFTDGSSPDPKVGRDQANMAVQSTNNALYPILYAEKNLMERLAKGVIQRMQITVKSGKGVEGVVHALGSSTVKFIKVSPDISLYSYGIKIEEKPTEQQKQQLLDRLNMKDAQGLIDPDVYVIVSNCDNLKQAEQILAYRVKKNREQQQQNAMANAQQTIQGQIQSAQAAEKAKQETLQVEYSLKGPLEMALKQVDLEIAKLKVQGSIQASQNAAGTDIFKQAAQHHADERQAKIEQGIPVPDMASPQPPQQQPMPQAAPEEQGEPVQGAQEEQQEPMDAQIPQ